MKKAEYIAYWLVTAKESVYVWIIKKYCCEGCLTEWNFTYAAQISLLADLKKIGLSGMMNIF